MNRDQNRSRLISRREALGSIGAVGAMIFVGCGQSTGTQSSNDLAPGADAATGADLGASPDLASGALDGGTLDCVVVPALTEGPFFVDEKLNRVDLTGGTTEPFVTGGLPLTLKFGVYQMTGKACTAFSGAQVDVWHASAEGVYSDEASGMLQSRSTVGEKYLRGYQTTDQSGAVSFTTIYPGWYLSRTVHIHFKVRVFSGGQKTYEFTSQVFIDDAINDVILAKAPYNTRGQRSVRNANDMVLMGQSTSAYLLNMKAANAGSGYVGTFNIGLQT